MDKERLKRAAFYAHEKPEDLAEVLAGEGSDNEYILEHLLKLDEATGAYSSQANGKSYEKAADALREVAASGGTLRFLKTTGDAAQEIDEPVRVSGDAVLDFTDAGEGGSAELDAKREGEKGENILVTGALSVKGGTIKGTGTEESLGNKFGVIALEGGGSLSLEGATIDSGEQDSAVVIRGGGGSASIDASSALKSKDSTRAVIANYGDDEGDAPSGVTLSGKAEASGEGNAAILSLGGAFELAIKEGATATSSGGAAVSVQGEKGRAVIEGGTITGSIAGIYAQKSSIEVRGGTISATGEGNAASDGSAITLNGGKLAISGGELSSTSGYAVTAKGDSELSITGGTFTGGAKGLFSVPEGAAKFISGGTFKSAEQPSAKWIADGHSCTGESGNWVVS